ncbi:UNVERIFIED_CONTAM: LINE-1 retrotransposable element O protein [Sesamum radiatum]|uniref:LINE-1 retrotransposable element O protein n=1 Tax=Sesamum radiatum TaxID=300843 RepID=A0AAW2RGC3_SESRA
MVLRGGTISTADSSRRSALRLKLDELLAREEMMWKQRGKVQWLREGDLNTAFFHAKASARQRKNTISHLRRQDGSWSSSAAEVQNIITSYFHGLFTSTRPSDADIEAAIEGLTTRVSTEMNSQLLLPFTADEVKNALFQMYPYKSPGPDGMSPIFFQKYWDVVGPDIISFTLSFLNDRIFYPKFNYTYIVLIPKCPNPELMSHFRPISLCNITYKIASKAIANRLKPFLNSIISEYQSAFLPGRLITDNVLVAYEINHYLAHKYWGSVGHMALKLDLSKAYDRVEWIFLERVLSRLGFDPSFISLIHSCVTTTSYSILLSGQKFGYFHPQRGLRQGDPLSPYLFLFCAEVFSCLISMAEAAGQLKGWQLVVVDLGSHTYYSQTIHSSSVRRRQKL